MTALIIIGCIVLFFALILSITPKVNIIYEDEFRLRVGIGFLMLTVVPKKKKKEPQADAEEFTYKKHQKRLEKDRKAALKKKKKDEAKAAKKAAKKAKKAKEKIKNAEEAAKKASETEEDESGESKLEGILELVKAVLALIPYATKQFHTEIKSLKITVGGKDPEITGKRYGRISLLAGLIIDTLENHTAMKRLKPGQAVCNADFLSEKTKIAVNISISVSLFSLVKIGVKFLIAYIRTQM